MKYCLIAFESTFEAIKCEKKLLETMPVMTIPTLREITVSCGVSLKISPDDYKEAIKTIVNDGIKASVYMVSGIGNAKEIKLLDNYS